MFSSLKYIIGLMVLLAIAGALVTGNYFKYIKPQELQKALKDENIALISGYNDTVWAHYMPSGKSGGDVPPEFTNESAQFFRGFKPTKVTIFSSDLKHLYYSSSNAVVSDENGARVPLFDLGLIGHGQMVTRILDESYFNAVPGHGDSSVLVQSILPIFSSEVPPEIRAACIDGNYNRSCAPIAYVEIYTDVTSDWRKLERQGEWLIGVIAAAFLLLGGVLLLTLFRAESIIARQHELNLELTAAAARAEAQSQDKSKFLASVSHELRTPLNAIIGFSEIVKNEAREQLQKVYLDYVEDIFSSGRHLLSLINDILDYSKAEAGRLQIDWAETDVTKVIRNSLRMVLPRAEIAQVTLVEEVPSSHLIVTTDPKKLKQVLLNLLSNAVKFTPPGGQVRCHTWEDVINHQVLIEVRDTGIGISPKDISRVMMPFGQVDSALSRKYEGTGLGLPLAKAFLESMGGKFSIESRVNVGTVVTITLPKIPRASLQPTPGVTHVATDQRDA